MALLITKNETILGDINVSQLYVRLIISYGPNGENISVNPYVYSSKEAYELSEDNYFRVEGVTASQNFIYNRLSEGSDILSFAHTSMKTLLSTDITENIPALDSSTGEEIFDPSTGETITKKIIIMSKFAMDSSILIDI